MIKTNIVDFVLTKEVKGDHCKDGFMMYSTKLDLLKQFIPKHMDILKLVNHNIIIDNYSLKKFIKNGCNTIGDVISYVENK